MPTSSEENKALIRRFWDAMNNRQLDLLDQLLASDVVRHCQATPGIEVRNRQQVKDFLRQDTAVFPDSIQTLTHLVAGNRSHLGLGGPVENMVGVWE